jgi:hypothetical protein
LAVNRDRHPVSAPRAPPAGIPESAPRCAQCVRLQHVLQEELGQELTGIALLLTAARRSPDGDPGLGTALARISDLLSAAIAACRCSSQRC